MNPQTARLTLDVPGEVHPLKCQSCGRTKQDCPIDRGPARWQEHDHNDNPEHRLIVLCMACSHRLIEPHPRLYTALGSNDPWPGCMSICLNCKLRVSVSCSSPAAKANGGPGVGIAIEPPYGALVDGRRNGKRRGWHQRFWPKAATGCKQKELL